MLRYLDRVAKQLESLQEDIKGMNDRKLAATSLLPAVSYAICKHSATTLDSEGGCAALEDLFPATGGAAGG